ncbi:MULTISPECIES: hypothetical protein [Acidobacterium]|uniref:Uncharacterized protein n=1 Tax=Acidobacterium capsulatum (strain ATCC 51196 / DSM 11244 / BCRC 80197 / JCM 7670 / NBRC 15755 / NCIMB 13165 / 161) TaxID=240015 RepID=C1F5Y6_ACIC5|nr:MULTISPECIES: hypothetical protein [Acidobacterium]ACO34661.1 hypothetical protein ACP_1395 [Acidobacterium capsulatum ATCC 51196]HCT60436.1 hypothetical protein [Acidobacterium sp.]
MESALQLRGSAYGLQRGRAVTVPGARNTALSLLLVETRHGTRHHRKVACKIPLRWILLLLLHPQIVLHTADFLGHSEADEVIQRYSFTMREIVGLGSEGRGKTKREALAAFIFLWHCNKSFLLSLFSCRFAVLEMARKENCAGLMILHCSYLLSMCMGDMRPF